MEHFWENLAPTVSLEPFWKWWQNVAILSPHEAFLPYFRFCNKNMLYDKQQCPPIIYSLITPQQSSILFIVIIHYFFN